MLVVISQHFPTDQQIKAMIRKNEFSDNRRANRTEAAITCDKLSN